MLLGYPFTTLLISTQTGKFASFLEKNKSTFVKNEPCKSSTKKVCASGSINVRFVRCKARMAAAILACSTARAWAAAAARATASAAFVRACSSSSACWAVKAGSTTEPLTARSTAPPPPVTVRDCDTLVWTTLALLVEITVSCSVVRIPNAVYITVPAVDAPSVAPCLPALASVELEVILNSTSPVSNLGLLELALWSGIWNVASILPDAVVFKTPPDTSVVSVVYVLELGVTNAETSWPSKNGYNLVFGKNPTPVIVIVLGLQKGIATWEIILEPWDSSVTSAITWVCVPVRVCSLRVVVIVLSKNLPICCPAGLSSKSLARQNLWDVWTLDTPVHWVSQAFQIVPSWFSNDAATALKLSTLITSLGAISVSNQLSEAGDKVICPTQFAVT